MLKVCQHLKVPSSGRAEMEKSRKWLIVYVFNFNSATRDTFQMLIHYMATWSKELRSIFLLKDGLVINDKAGLTRMTIYSDENM